ncbi:MAG TPA: tetratricopeptide repeat protein, partial [Ardenticatenaceae bacterium]|nr:tetratricopeptide repeat protein [Ardenticatenaceae bacterium]
MSDTTATHDLLAEGIAAARAGDTEQAARLLRRVTELDPSNADAWLWRSSLTENLADKKAFLTQVLELQPDNVEARLAMDKVIEREGALAERATEEMLHCSVHPDRETMLRCNRCGRPMCPECAVRTPVGLRCRECVA